MSQPVASDYEAVKHRAARSVVALLFREGGINLIRLTAYVILARVLEPLEFGLFALVEIVVLFFGRFADVGLGAALIQKREPPTERDLRTTFLVQQVLAVTAVGLAWVAAPYVTRGYVHFSPARVLGAEIDVADVVRFIRVLAVSFLFTSLKTIPAARLQRGMRFGRLAMAELLATLVFRGGAVALALLGYGAASFVYAAFLRELTSLILLYAVAPWRPRFGFDREAFRELVRFGLPYQLNIILAWIKDCMTPIMVGLMLGLQAVGYVGVSKTFAAFFLLFVTIVGRVVFPAFARMQDRKELLGHSVERTIELMSLLLIPAVAIALGLIPQIVRLIIGLKWDPAIWLFYLFTLNVLLVFIIRVLCALLFSLGRSGTVFRFMVMWTALTWTIGVPLLFAFRWAWPEDPGRAAAAVAATDILVGTTLVVVVMVCKRHVPFRVLPAVIPAVLLSVLPGLAAWWAGRVFVGNIGSLLLVALLCMLFYGVLVYIFRRGALRTALSLALGRARPPATD